MKYSLAAAACALAAVAVQAPSLVLADPTLDDIRLSFYDYDRTLLLNPELKELAESGTTAGTLRTRYHLAYDSAHAQRVTAIFTKPNHFAPPYPAVILLAGSGGNKDTDYVRIASDLFSNLGYATISIDAQYHGERAKPGHTGDFHLINSPENRDAWIQTVIDLRRAVDYLESRPDIDAKHIGYMGFSQGGIAGGTFLGVEPRIAAACLAVAGGGLVEWSKLANLWRPEYAHEIELNAAVTDPIYFIGRFAPHPLLMVSAKKDELIPKAATDALYNAAGEPKQILWVEGTHASPVGLMQAVATIRSFFVKYLGARQPS